MDGMAKNHQLALHPAYIVYTGDDILPSFGVLIYHDIRIPINHQLVSPSGRFHNFGFHMRPVDNLVMKAVYSG